MSQERSKQVCPSGGGELPTIRNRYFTGKYMTARDFAGEQHYMLSRQRLHNRLFHGWGIVCGLQVEPHPHPDCQPGWIVVKAGVAIDCYGREIVLPEDTPVEIPLDQLPLPIAEEQEPEEGQAEPAGEHGDEARQRRAAAERHGSLHKRRGKHHHHGDEGEEPHEEWYEDWPENGLLVCLRYCEEEVEPVPALYAESGCDLTHHEANRIREVAGMEFHRLSDLPRCWRVPGGAPGFPCRDDCDEPMPGPGGVCLEPDCPCGTCVPLALLVPLPESTLEAPNYVIDTRGRRQLLTEHHLTHIVETNWTHGALISLRELRDEMGGELRIRFDRKINEAEGIATGVNRRTFTVQFGGITRHLEFLPLAEDRQPVLDDDGCTAVYPIDPRYLKETELGRENIADSFVYITLRCDFILDCHGTSVDGNHLHGRLPSGDGRQGGEFVSWFRVVHSPVGEEEY